MPVSHVYMWSCSKHGQRDWSGLWSPASSAFQPLPFHWLQILCGGERVEGMRSAYKMNVDKKKRTAIFWLMVFWEMGRCESCGWPETFRTWKVKLCFPSIFCWLGAHVFPSQVRADPRHCSSGGSWDLVLFRVEAGQFLLLFWQIFNSLTEEGLKLLTDFTWVSWLGSVLKNDGIMLIGLNRKSTLDLYLP